MLVVFISFGPYIHIAGKAFPGLFLFLVKAVPFTTQMRCPSRFMALGFLFLALLSGIAVVWWLRSWGRKEKF